MFGNRCSPRIGGFEMRTQPFKQRAAPSVPKALNGFNQHNVGAGLNHCTVKGAVTFQRQHAVGGVEHHVGDGLAHGIHVFAFGLDGGDGGDFTFHHAACAYQLKWPPVIG